MFLDRTEDVVPSEQRKQLGHRAEGRGLGENIETEVPPLEPAPSEVAPLGEADRRAIEGTHRQRVAVDDVLGEYVGGGAKELVRLVKVQVLNDDLQEIRTEAEDISLEDGRLYYQYRGKGGKTGRRGLPAPAHQAICTTLANCSKTLDTMAPDKSLWQAGSPNGAISGSTFYGRLNGYFQKAGVAARGVHVLRHSGAKLRRDAGESHRVL